MARNVSSTSAAVTLSVTCVASGSGARASAASVAACTSLC